MTKLVEMAGIEKHFPGVYALKNVSFDIEAGEVHALMGENGAGKSTLMKILSGVYTKDAGSVRAFGEEVVFEGPRAAQDAGIGIIHQELSLMNDLTVAQNIFIGREPRGRFGKLDEAKLNANAAELFTQLNIDILPTDRIEGMSVAKQQMIEIAKALSYRSRVLIMDEPTAALTNTEIRELFAMIEKLKSDGVGIVYISHRMDEIKQISDRITVMRDGEYVDTVPAAQTPINHIITLMVGRELVDAQVIIPNLEDAETALEIKGLKRGRMVRDVSFSVKKGEILGFAGLMGAGRTEVARAIFGADTPEAGEVIVHGQPVKIRSTRDAVRAGIGYLSEDRKHHGLALGMDVRANIGLASMDQVTNAIGRINENRLAQTAAEYIKKLGIRTPSDQQEVGLLSGGNQQKVVIAKWLMRDCDILIFDEPTRGIDVGAKAEIYRLMRQLADEGKAIIVISSELPEILRLSHRIAVMCEGQLTGILPGGVEQEEVMALATQRETTKDAA